MKAENSAQRKKMLARFGALYAGSMALVIVIFTLFSGQETSGSPVDPDYTRLPEKSGSSVERADTLLRRHLDRLITLDQEYAALLMDSSGSTDLTGMDKMITAAEAALKNSIDSLDKEGAPYNTGTGSYRMTLEDRRPIASLRAALAAGLGKKTSVDQLELLRLKMELSEKEGDLAVMGDHLKTVGENKEGSATGQNSTAAGQEMLLTLQNENNALKESAASLRHANEVLTVKLQGAVRPAGSAEPVANPSGDRVSEWEARSAELSAELRFAQVDCNLSRADARQVVYNSKQRKDLLQDALTTLKELAASDNATIQKKAKEKLLLLRNIASTVHD